VKLDELMIERPFAVHARLFHAALAHVSFYSPVTNEVIEEWILEWRRLPLRTTEQE